MSNTTKGRFKSKALSYAFTKTREWMDECEKALRYGKIAVQWGVKLALSPLYALFQASRLVGHQLQGTVREAVLRLPWGHPSSPPEADIPLQTVVNLLEQLLVAVPEGIQDRSQSLATLQSFIPEVAGLNPFHPKETLPAWKQAVKTIGNLVNRLRHRWYRIPSPLAAGALIASSKPSLLTQIRQLGHLTLAPVPVNDITASRLQIQGVASELATRELVLVAWGNQMLNILSPTQKQQLQARIVWEIANYWQRRKRQERRLQVVRAQVRRLKSASTSIWDWATLHFRDRSAQLALPGESGVGFQPMIALPPVLIQSIRQALSTLSPLFQGSQPTGLPEIGQSCQRSLALLPSPQPLLQLFWNQLPRIPLLSALFSGGQSIELPRLPGSGVEPSFGLMLDFGLTRFVSQRFQTKQLWQWQQPSWLTFRDLGGTESEPESESEAINPVEDPLDWTRVEPASQSWFRSWLAPLQAIFHWFWQPIQWIWQQGFGLNPALPPAAPPRMATPQNSPSLRSRRSLRPSGNLSLRETLAALIGNQPEKHQPVTIRSVLSPALVTETGDGVALEFNPDWIEVESIALGYVKSPLELILNWLDHLFFWIETVVVALWRWIGNWVKQEFRP